MSFQTIVNNLCDEFYTAAIATFKQNWLSVHRIADIEAETQRQYHAYRPRNDQLWNPWFDNDRYLIRQRILNEYAQQFTTTMVPHLRDLWNKKIQEENFVSHLERFFRRHPWLSALATLEHPSSLPTQYIKHIISSSLQDPDYRFKLLRNGDCSTAASYSIQWPQVNPQMIMQRLNNYPLDLIVREKYDQLSILPSLNNHWNSRLELKQYHLSRLDVYRMLVHNFNIDIRKVSVVRGIYGIPDQLHSTEVTDHNTGQIAAKIMPVELSELAELDAISKSYCQSWLINLESTENPYWILLNKHQNKNSLYIPTELKRDRQFASKLSVIQAVFPINEIVPIDNECETSYTDLPYHLIWQYQLFARVLPYCIAGNHTIPLHAYRNRISLYHLVAYVWESFIPHAGLTLTNLPQSPKRFQHAYPLGEIPWHQLLLHKQENAHWQESSSLQAKEILKTIDQNKITIAPNKTPSPTLTLTTIVEGDYFLQACFMACFHSISQIALTLTPASKKDMPDIPAYIFDKTIERLTYVSFTINSKYETINPGHFPPLVRLSNGAACNRLLQATYSHTLTDLALKNRLEEAGRLIFLVFTQDKIVFTPNTIQTYLQQEKIWRKDWFNPEQAPRSNSFYWKLTQFAQMGRLGLDAFFDYLRSSHLKHWHAIHQTPQLNIPVLFDLNGDHLLSATEYIEHLNEQLSNFINDERCTPKFSQIHLILPNPPTRAAREETAKLIRHVSDCKYKHSQETEAFYLYEFKTLRAEKQDTWLKAFETLAEQEVKPLIAMLRIPDLDTQVSSDTRANTLKTRYRALQNKILDNQRLHYQQALTGNTAIFYQGANGTLDPMVDIRNLQHRLKQPFEGNDETILLSANTGIQQELQQNVEARHEIAQQIEEKQIIHEERDPEIKPYDLDLSQLVTRHTIQNHLKSTGELIDWVTEFSFWVGSRVDAPHLMNYIDPQALKKIGQHRPFFQMSVEPKHLPFGFYLAHYPNAQSSYILCYDENRAKQEQYEWETKPKELRNPFIPHLDSKATTVHFDGDFRQFHLIGDEESAQVSFWHHLATHLIAYEQKERQANCLQQVSPKHLTSMQSDISILMTRYETSGNFSDRPWNAAKIKEHLASWAQAILSDGTGHDFIGLDCRSDQRIPVAKTAGPMDPGFRWEFDGVGSRNGCQGDFIRLFIMSMNDAELKTFGQLCYHFDSKKRPLGSEHFLRVAYTLYQTFGEHHFIIWRNAILANSKNATELLEKPILDAMGLSLITLKDKSPAFTNTWFYLLAAQAHHVGLARYDRLWYAYQTLIAYIDKRQLNLDDDVIRRLLSRQRQFQPIIWLDRLLHCLKMTEGQLYESNAQQTILDNLDKIDWHSNGLLYAMAHNQMPYWSEDLALQQFECAHKGYEPIWDQPIAKKTLSVQFGRYLAAKLRINFKQYQHYAKQIKPLLENDQAPYSVARLLLIHLTHGIDTVLEWESDELNTLLTELRNDAMMNVVIWLNQLFSLDQKNRGDRYQVTLAQLPLICRVLQRYGLEKLASAPVDKSIRLLNALGKTCQYLRINSSTVYSTTADSLLKIPSSALRAPSPHVWGEGETEERSPTVVQQLEQMTTHALKNADYLTTMRQTPWLLLDRSKPWVNWAFSTHAENLYCQKQLLQQLESISYSTSAWLPSREDISEALALLTNESTLDDTRRQIIARWVDNGCDITEQDATLRELTVKEKESVIFQFTEQLLPQHITENAALIAMLVPHLAIEATLINPQQAFTNFVTQFKRIDNKPHFNDLAIVLGSLIHHIKKQAPAKMSMQQLTDMVESLMLADHDELTHFPNSMLVELLSQAGKTLTSHQLNDLSAKFAPSLKNNVKLIINAAIPHQIGLILLSLLPKGLDVEQITWIVNNFTSFGLNGISIPYQIELAKALLLTVEAPLAERDKLINTLLYLPDDSEIKPLWLKIRHQLLKTVNKAGSLAPLQIIAPLLLSNEQNIPELEIIGIQTLAPSATNTMKLQQTLQTLNKHDLVTLAQYCSHPPTPSAEYLLQNLSKYMVGDLIHRFETIEQAKGLRHYSVTTAEKQELKRILGGIKEKSTGYISDAKQKQIMGLLYYVNAYAQERDLENIPSAQLKNALRQTAQWLQAAEDETTKRTYRLQLLSMLREVLLRQTGKWANHTQMLDLIYAALHNDESLFHQVKTGQGKSIITIIRVAFHALNGKVVDVFTAKESLSSRDHDEFGLILDAIGIEHCHIIPNSSENTYKVGDNVFGAVNYMTPSSFSLYQSGHCWADDSNRYINYRSKERVAFFDEGDHVLLDEQTMFNFSYGGDSGKLYNYDAWVYQATWRYFQTIKDNLPTNGKGTPYLSRKKHLADLCEYLQSQGDFAPVQSNFVKTYLSPVVDSKVKDKKAAMIKRDKILVSLLQAAHTAHLLKENRDYCVQSDTITLTNGVTIEGRVAKVVINNQVQDGATYSERTHQFLLVHLNEQALAKGEQPNFFITPDSSVVLSQNVPTLIQNYYSQIEGCSGTMGDTGELAVYQERFGINHVIKIPTHEVSQTVYKGTIFCEGQDEYEQTIIACLKDHSHQPTLLVSSDDVAVKLLSNRLRTLLPEPMAAKLICDTNDSGQSEKDILPHAGKPGAITNSSRMARGTDIKPGEDGLLVIRADPDTPRQAKQSGGRQGRNGEKGVLIDIIDYAKVRHEYESFAQSDHYARRLTQLMEREHHHLQMKLEKHQIRHSSKWDWLQNDTYKQDQYLKTRVVQYLKREIKNQCEQNIRSKEALVCACSSHIITQLMHHIGEDQTVMRAIRKEWVDCRELIESAWQQRLTGAVEDNEMAFDVFYEKAAIAWQNFAIQYPDYIDPTLLDDKNTLLHSVRSMSKLAWNTRDETVAISEPTQRADMTEVIHFYQYWLKRVGPLVLSDSPASLQQVFYGKANKGLNDLDAFYQALVGASQQINDDDSQKLIENTQALFTQLASLPLPDAAHVPLLYMVDIVKTLDAARIEPNFLDKLACLAQLFDHPCAQLVTELDAHHMTILGETCQFIIRLACRGFVAQNTDDFRRFTTSQTVNHIADVLWQHWQALTPNQFACFNRFINQDQAVTCLLTTRHSPQHWQTLLSQLGRYDSSKPEDTTYLDTVMNYFRDNHALLNNSHSQTLNALLGIFFYYPRRRVDMAHFPTPNCLIHASHEDNIRFIHFVAEQYMINATEIAQLVEIINQAYGEDKVGADTMATTVMPTITSLPHNIPFEMILPRLKRIADNQNLLGFTEGVKALTDVGKALNAFTNSKGITTPENPLPAEGAPETLLKRAQAIMLTYGQANQLYAARKILVQLSQPKYDSLSADTCLMAVEQYHQDYEALLALLLRAKTVMEASTFSQFYDACFAHDDDKPGLAHLTNVVTVFEKYGELFATRISEKQSQQRYIIKQCLHHTGIDTVIKKFKALNDRQISLDNIHAWQQWQRSEENQCFDEQIKLIKALDGLAPELENRVSTLLDEGYDQSRLIIFVTLAKQNSQTADAISTEQLLYILRKWQERKIQDGEHLKNIFEAQKLANTLATETRDNARARQTQNIPTFESIFITFDKNTQGKSRIPLMHSITHSLISFTEEVQTKCWSCYRTLISKIGDIKTQIGQLPEDKRSASLSHILRSMKGLTMELFLVAKPEGGLVNTGDNVNDYYQLIRSFEQQYTGSWLKYFSINRTRWQQAQTLFEGLKTIADPTKAHQTQATFYESMLVVINTTQQDIIDNDAQNKIANKKGYSRLLDITQQLGLQTCKDIIADPALGYVTKQKAHDWLLSQEKMVVHQLWQRLPSNHPIIAELEPYARNTNNQDPAMIHRYRTAMTTLQASDLPQEVQYLLPLLKGHFEITEEMEVQARQARALM